MRPGYRAKDKFAPYAVMEAFVESGEPFAEVVERAVDHYRDIEHCYNAFRQSQLHNFPQVKVLLYGGKLFLARRGEDLEGNERMARIAWASGLWRPVERIPIAAFVGDRPSTHGRVTEILRLFVEAGLPVVEVQDDVFTAASPNTVHPIISRNFRGQVRAVQRDGRWYLLALGLVPSLSVDGDE